MRSDKACAYPLPNWIDHWFQTDGQALIKAHTGHIGFMNMVIELSRLNYTQGLESEQGGPFAAAVVHREQQKVISLGVNRVVPLNTSTAHAEVIALCRAQQTLGVFSLREDQARPYILYTSAQMCAMCCGAVCWSGIGEVVFGAKAEDTQRLTGFDEGPIHPQWRQELEARQIKITGPVLAEQAKTVLADYRQQEKIIYAG